MSNPSTSVLPLDAPRQLSMALDSVRLRRMNPSEREAVLAQLARLLMEAASIAVREPDHDER